MLTMNCRFRYSRCIFLAPKKARMPVPMIIAVSPVINRTCCILSFLCAYNSYNIAASKYSFYNDISIVRLHIKIKYLNKKINLTTPLNRPTRTNNEFTGLLSSFIRTSTRTQPVPEVRLNVRVKTLLFLCFSGYARFGQVCGAIFYLLYYICILKDISEIKGISKKPF